MYTSIIYKSAYSAFLGLYAGDYVRILTGDDFLCDRIDSVAIYLVTDPDVEIIVDINSFGVFC